MALLNSGDRIDAFVRNIRVQYEKSWNRFNDLVFEYEHADVNVDDDGDVDAKRAALIDAIRRLILGIQLALEQLGDSVLLHDFRRTVQGRDVLHVEPPTDMAHWNSPILHDISAYVDVLEDACGAPALERRLLEDLLQGTGTWLLRNEIVPAREEDIKRPMNLLLKQVFPTSHANPQIGHIFKVFEADCGIPDLLTAIEYKYIDAPEKLGSTVASLYEDFSGYEGSRQWQRFYAVIYQTRPFATKQELIREKKLARIGDNWDFFLVHGQGKDGGESKLAPPTKATSGKRDKGRAKS